MKKIRMHPTLAALKQVDQIKVICEDCHEELSAKIEVCADDQDTPTLFIVIKTEHNCDE
jgi:hypothetical protein